MCCCLRILFTQQITLLEKLVLCAFTEPSNVTLHSNHLIFRVCCFVSTLFTQTDNEIETVGTELFARVLRRNTALKSLNISGVLVRFNTIHTADNDIGESGVFFISRALQSNTSLKSLVIASVPFAQTLFT